MIAEQSATLPVRAASTWRKLILLAAQPLLVLILSLGLRSDRGPYWQSRFFDPDYVYLFSALTVARLHMPHHNDHPGITVQVAGGAFLHVVDAVDRVRGARPAELLWSVPADPERYLRLLSDAMLVLAAMSSFGAAVVALRLGLRVRSALLLQASWLLTPIILSHGIRVTPEAAFPILLPWIGLLLLWYAQPAARWTDRVSVFTGVLLALLMATKINALPWLVLVFLPGTLKDGKRITAVFAAALAVLLLPIYKRVLPLLKWMVYLTSHKGRYGSSGPGFVDPGEAARAFADSVVKETALFIVGVLLVIAFVRQSRFARAHIELAARESAARRRRALAVAAVAVWASILITTKHPAADFLPTEHYLLPVSGVLGALFVLAFDGWSPNPGGQRWPKWSLVVLIVLALHTAQLRAAEAAADHRARIQTAKLLASVAAVDAACIRVYHYRSSSLELALSFANDFNNGEYSIQIGTLHPGGWLTYDLAGRVRNAPRVLLPTETLGNLTCLVHQGTPRDSLPPFRVRRVEELSGSWEQERAVVVQP